MRVARSSFIATVLVLVVFAAASVALADGRVALVVGNSTYDHIGRLPNPENDAVDMAAALQRLGFDVTTERDADRVLLTEALRAFTRRSAGADVSLVFYAGHGIEIDGVNYVVPVDARLERDVDVRYETVTLDDLLVSTSGASLRLVFLDACRNNPLARSMQRTAATRTVSGGSFGDLNEDLLGDETLVAYAAAAGTTAADGRGRNSPYTAALLTHLETPLEIGLLFRRVRAQVLEATNGEQRPHEYHSLVSEHYLTRTLPAGVSVTVSAVAPATPAPADPPRPDPPETDVTELPIAALRGLAEAGDATAQTELGERYEHARGVEEDYGVAVSWFRRAADQGYAPGQAALGFVYANGLGVPQDDAEAIRWSLRAAEQGNARGQSNIGAMYAAGRGVERNDAEAVHWFRRSAEQGDAGGQNTSASCTGPVVGCHGTTRRPCPGSAVLPSRGMPAARTTSEGCTRPAGAYGGTASKLSDGTAWQPGRGMSWLRRTSTAFVDGTVGFRGAAVRCVRQRVFTRTGGPGRGGRRALDRGEGRAQLVAHQCPGTRPATAPAP